MTAYRDPTTPELADFADHITLAETMFGVHADLRTQLAAEPSADLHHTCTLAWVQLWDQLVHARAIAVRFGRDVTEVDAAAQRANPHAIDSVITEGHRDATLTAFAELRRCIPEVVVPTSIPVVARPATRPVRIPVQVWYALGSLIALLWVAAQRAC